MDKETPAAQREQVNGSFEAWFGGLLWPDPYPDYEAVARMAWEAALAQNQPK